MDRRFRLAALVAVLLGLAFALFAYRSYDPRAERALDASEALPEGPGLAPRPPRVESTPTRALGRWLHDRLDDLLGLKESSKRSVDEVSVVPSTAVFGRPGGLRVRVRGSDGRLVSDVPVTVYALPGASMPAMRRTDAGGEVIFEGLPSGPGYVVEARGVGAWYGPLPSARTGARVEVGVVQDVDVTLPGGTVEGQVVDEQSGDPVPHATVEVLPIELSESGDSLRTLMFAARTTGAPLGSTIANAEGRFRLGPFPAGPGLELRARADDGREGSLGFVVGGAALPVFRVGVGRPLAVTGVVIDEDDVAVPDVLVRISCLDVATRTDAHGHFDFDRMQAGYFVVEWNGASVSRVPTDFDPVGRVIRLRLSRRTALVVRVIDATGSVVRQAPVSLIGTADSGSDGEQRYWVLARTDAEGRARIPVLPGRVESIRVASVAGVATFESGDEARTAGSGVLYADLGEAFRVGEVRDLTLTLPRGLSVRGRAVLGDGRPAAGARVVGTDGRQGGEGPRAVSDTEGRFLLVGLDPSGTGGEAPALSITAEIEGVAVGELDLVDRRPDSMTGEFDVGDVVLRPGAMIRGRVVDADGAPVVGATVGGGSAGGAVLTDAQGVYRLPIRSTKFVTFPVVAPGWRERRLHVHGVIPPGVVRDVEPIVLRRPVTIRVRVVDLADRPVDGARVRVARTPLDPNAGPPRTDARGVVDVAGFAASSRKLTSQDEDGFHLDFGAVTDGALFSEGVQVTLAEDFVVERELVVPEDASDPYEIVVHVPARLVLEGVVRDERGAAVAGATVNAGRDYHARGVSHPDDTARTPYAARRAKTDSTGRYRLVLGGVPGERWKIKAEPTAGRPAEATVVLERDATLDLVLGQNAGSDAK